jgi:phosphoenolpyruvate carboxykinase (GTP)
MKMLQQDTIFTNTAYNPQSGDVWWEGMGPPPSRLIDWKGQEWTPDMADKVNAAHPNSRFTTSIANCPIGETEVDLTNGNVTLL